MYWWFPPDFWTTNRIYRIWKKLCTSTGVDLILLGGQLGLKKLQCGKVLLEVTFQCACRMSVNGWSGFRRSQKVGELTYFSTVFWKSLFFFGGGIVKVCYSLRWWRLLGNLVTGGFWLTQMDLTVHPHGNANGFGCQPSLWTSVSLSGHFTANLRSPDVLPIGLD